jgi:hypothetical protein
MRFESWFYCDVQSERGKKSRENGEGVVTLPTPNIRVRP